MAKRLLRMTIVVTLWSVLGCVVWGIVWAVTVVVGLSVESRYHPDVYCMVGVFAGFGAFVMGTVACLPSALKGSKRKS